MNTTEERLSSWEPPSQCSGQIQSVVGLIKYGHAMLLGAILCKQRLKYVLIYNRLNLWTHIDITVTPCYTNKNKLEMVLPLQTSELQTQQIKIQWKTRAKRKRRIFVG